MFYWGLDQSIRYTGGAILDKEGRMVHAFLLKNKEGDYKDMAGIVMQRVLDRFVFIPAMVQCENIYYGNNRRTFRELTSLLVLLEREFRDYKNHTWCKPVSPLSINYMFNLSHIGNPDVNRKEAMAEAVEKLFGRSSGEHINDAALHAEYIRRKDLGIEKE